MENSIESQENELLEDKHDLLGGDNDDGLSLDDLLDEAEQEATQEAEPSEEETAANHERAERLAQRFNSMLWWGLSKTYPAAEVEEEKINAGTAALVPLAEKYGDSMPEWIDDFMEKPEIKAGFYIGAAIMAARSSHINAITSAQEDAEKSQGGNGGEKS